MKKQKDRKGSLSPERKHNPESGEEVKVADPVRDIQNTGEKPNAWGTPVSSQGQEFLGTFFPFRPQAGLLPPLSSFAAAQRPDLTHVPYGLQELTGAQQLETLCNKVSEIISLLGSNTLDPTQITTLKQELSYTALDLHSVFPNIALNPALCEKWSRAFKAAIEGSQRDSSTLIKPVPYLPPQQM